MSSETIIALAPNGAYKQKTDHPAVPLSLSAIVNTAVTAKQRGASLLHLHIRDEQQLHSLDPQTYLSTIAAIEDQLNGELIIQITSEAAKRYTPLGQIACIKAVNAACVSIALREIIAEPDDLKAAQDLFHWCAEQACRIQFILYSESDLTDYFAYLQRDIIPDTPHSVLFVLGRYSVDGQSSPADLKPFLAHLEQLRVPWMVCAFGASEQDCLLDAAHHGGHMRIGFENNLLRPNGSQALDNTQQIKNLTTASNKASLTIASVKQAREILSIRS